MNKLVGWIWCPNWLCVYELLYLNLLFLQIQADNIMLKERKLNIAPAIKKQVKRRKRSLSQKWTGNEWGGRSKNNLMICFRGLLVNCNSYWVIYFSKPTASRTTWGSPSSTAATTTAPQVESRVPPPAPPSDWGSPANTRPRCILEHWIVCKVMNIILL